MAEQEDPPRPVMTPEATQEIVEEAFPRVSTPLSLAEQRMDTAPIISDIEKEVPTQRRIPHWQRELAASRGNTDRYRDTTYYGLRQRQDRKTN